jgi:hypothetical protein
MTLVKDLLFLSICKTFAVFDIHFWALVFIEGPLEEEAESFCTENEVERLWFEEHCSPTSRCWLLEEV